MSALTSSDANHPLMTQSPLDSPRALSPASTGEGGLDVAPRAVRVRPTRAASMSPTPSSTEFSDNESVAGERWRSLSDAGTSATAIDDSMSVSAEQAAASAFIMSNRSTTSISESPSRYTPAATATNTSDEFSTSFAQPLCQMMLALFDFQEQNPLLQESAALLLVKQGLLGHQPQMSADE